ncbi:hypothetical protein BDP27DRAFT_1422122 [Rhodocollybia butyracea]|uniref:HECT domain-containing protein n=1 Tax=Rhodocollybia butyracea TaxID=206335 RepID=A0A9P5PRS6_9AGAR|nr:hypothetical protein BDP27DRAFT_1422122 [Rhodocollybia butyracea]
MYYSLYSGLPSAVTPRPPIVSRWALTRENHFHIFAILRRYPLEASLNLSKVFLGEKNLVRTHCCISQRVYGLFRHDVDSVDVPDLDEEAMEQSQECVTSVEEEVDKARVVAQLLTPAPFVSQPVASLAASPPAVAPTPLSSPTISSNLMTCTSSSLGTEKLWETRWVLPSRLDLVPEFFNPEQTLRIFETVHTCHIQIHGGGCRGVDIEGSSDAELVQKMEMIMKDAICSHDWSQVLSPTRHFARTRITSEGNSVYVSGGPGVEQEVMNALFKSYFDHEDEFCTALIDEHTMLTAMPNTQTSDLSPLKRKQLILYGAVSALALVYGSYPGHFNPLLLIYFLNNCNLHCLHRNLIVLYFPFLVTTLDAWLMLDPNDDVCSSQFLTHFSTFHNISELGVLNGRSEERHRTLAFEMLHNAIIGPVGVKNAYFQLFLEGFKLPCSGSLDLFDIVRSFHGGPEDQSLVDACAQAGLEFMGKDFETIFHEFLVGRGAPCPQLLDSQKDRFSRDINLERIGSSTFRMEVLCWAVSGAPRIMAEGDALKVNICLQISIGDEAD